jgi:hypothetical protein
MSVDQPEMLSVDVVYFIMSVYINVGLQSYAWKIFLRIGSW